jgi:uncharacterized protein GlcG (DUF336 family)
MQGGVPIRIGGTVVGAVGISGFDKSKDVENLVYGRCRDGAAVVQWARITRSV